MVCSRKTLCNTHRTAETMGADRTTDDTGADVCMNRTTQQSIFNIVFSLLGLLVLGIVAGAIVVFVLKALEIW